MQKVHSTHVDAGRWAAACCRQVLVFMKVLEKSQRLSGARTGAEVTVGEKLLIRDFEQLTYQLPQAGTLLLFSKSGTEYQHLYALISFPGKVTEDNQYI